jgi:uncharacterized protein
MKVDLAKLEDSRTSFDFILHPSEIDLEDEEINLIDEVKVKGKLTKHIAQTDVEGEISTKFEIECSRCLKKIESDLDTEFSAAFVSPDNYTKQSEKELDSDELEVSIIENEEIDLKELVREQILLAVPAQVFCKDDCKGLCRVCGADKNLIDCNCEQKEIDPRWAALKNFKK